MIQTVEKFCSEKRLRFGYGFEGGLNDFFSRDANGVYVIIGRPRVGVTEGDVVLRGNAVQYRDELAAMLGRNGNSVSRRDNRLHVVFRIARPMSSGGTGYQPTPPTPSADYLYFEAKQANSTVSMISTLTTAPTLEYSDDDGATWQEWEHTTSEGTHTFDTLTIRNVGDKVYLRGTNTELADLQNQQMSVFMLSGSIDAGGSVTSLLDNDGITLTALPDGALTMLFASAVITQQPDTALVTAPNFGNITTIGNGGCTNMYYGCTSLTTASDMGSVTTIGVGGCRRMYQACISLTSTADMCSVTTIGDSGCGEMYSGCTSLTSTADMGSLNTIGDYGCAEMYRNCTLLTTAADMSSVTTIGDYGCNNMYYGCTSLTAAADMSSVTTIGDYGCNNMYYGCTSLTAAADMGSLTTIGNHGCEAMYRNCTLLTTAADISSVTTIGDYGCKGMYRSCTSLTSTTDMGSLTTIGDYGCAEMYRGCTSLTTAADMGSLTTIGDYGCGEMYLDCTSLTLIDNGALTFAFPTPPITDGGGNTYSTAQEVADWMTGD